MSHMGSPKLKQHWLFSQKAAVLALVLITILLIIEHWSHLIIALPYLVLIACPIMHLFVHGGHPSGKHHDKK